MKEDPDEEATHCAKVCIFTIRTVYNFSNFVALCTDDTDTPVSCDERFRDFWRLCSNLSPIISFAQTRVSQAKPRGRETKQLRNTVKTQKRRPDGSDGGRGLNIPTANEADEAIHG